MLMNDYSAKLLDLEGNTQVSESWDFQADQYAIGKEGTLLEMCKALFAYSDSALAYFGK